MTVYIIGIKGVGTTALAQLYQALGHTVRGSDVPETFFTDDVLQKAGVRVYESFKAEHITPDIDMVVVSAAFLIQENHVELHAAREQGLVIYSYSEALGKLAEPFEGIGVTGTHGKSTTTALLGVVLVMLEVDPFVVVGSSVAQLGGNARAGQPDSRFFVAELDEYRYHFLDFSPDHTILTTLDYDHPDVFPDSQTYRDAFHSYLDKLPEGGLLVANISNEGVRSLLEERPNTDHFHIVTYGCSAGADIFYEPETRMVKSAEQAFGELELQLQGMHNAVNATGVFALLWHLGYDPNRVLRALKRFHGLKRRQEFRGRSRSGATVIDDYAHHPAEIRAVYEALKASHPDHTVWLVFQPHTYSRTKALKDELAVSLSLFDHVLLAPIYASAREEAGTVHIHDLQTAIEAAGEDTKVRAFEDKDPIEEFLRSNTGPDDIIVTMGAGDINLLAEHLVHDT
jgi:UDP-N-acetylmuramate--alanine ligase